MVLPEINHKKHRAEAAEAKLCRLWFLLNLLVFVVTQAVFTNYSGESSSASIMAPGIGADLFGTKNSDFMVSSWYLNGIL